MTCGETAGFLFHHDCGREADANCHLCGKFICRMHTRVAEGQIFCIACLKRYLADRPAAAEQQIQQPAQAAQQQIQQPAQAAQQARQAPYAASPWYVYDDPYWYTDTHYPHYHEHDLTSQDRKAFEATPETAGAAGPAEEAFETDKTAS